MSTHLRASDMARDALARLAAANLDTNDTLNTAILTHAMVIFAGAARVDSEPAAAAHVEPQAIIAVMEPIIIAEPIIAAAVPAPAIAAAAPAPVAAIPYIAAAAMLRGDLKKMCETRGLNVGARGFHQFLKEQFAALLEAGPLTRARPRRPRPRRPRPRRPTRRGTVVTAWRPGDRRTLGRRLNGARADARG